MRDAQAYRTVRALKGDLMREFGKELAVYTDDGYLEGNISLNGPGTRDWECGDDSVQLGGTSYCCGIPELGDWCHSDDDAPLLPYLARAAILAWGPIKGYLMTTVTDHQKRVIDALDQAGWTKRIKLKSNHGEYNIYVYEWIKNRRVIV